MKKLLGFSVAVTGALFIAASAQAQVVSLVYGSSPGLSLTAGVSAGVLPETLWNNDTCAGIPYFADGSSSLSNLTDSTGTVTGISEGITTQAGYHQGGAITGFANPGDNDLFNHGPYVGNAPTQGGVLTLSGLNTADSYNLYIYVNDPNGAPNTLCGVTDSVDSQTYFLKSISNASMNAYVSGTATVSGTAGPGNYFEFTNLSGASGSLTASLSTGGMCIDGFQLQTVTASVPEPATFWGLGLGLLGLVGFQVRRNRLARS